MVPKEMKSLSQFVTEKLKLKKDESSLCPKTKTELFQLICEEINENGYDCDLNHIDVSKITDMSLLFNDRSLRGFVGDISEWNTSNVTNMASMFSFASFNGDISKWNVSNVETMESMFSYSKFNQDISDWDVSNVKNMEHMFSYSLFKGDISDWDTSNIKKNMNIFYRCDIDKKHKPKM